MANPGLRVILDLQDEAATEALARRLAPCLCPGDAVLLSGDLGAGKSLFARAVIRARLGDPDAEVPSPTYTLVQVYEDPEGVEIWHADLYRLSGEDDVAETGLAEAMDSAICLIEWPDRLGGRMPAGALRLDLDLVPGDEGRRLSITADTPRWRDILDDLARHDRQVA